MCLFIETIRVKDGVIYNLDYHTERLNRTRAFFWRGCVPLDLRESAFPLPSVGTYKCRLVYGKEIQEVAYMPYRMRPVSSLRLVASDSIEYTYKSVHRENLNLLYGQRGMADDVLIVKEGCLTDTSIANVALFDGKVWCTPACPLLRGTKRAELLDKKMIVEKDIRQTQLGEYSSIMLFNAMIDWGRIVLPVDSSRIIL